MNKNEFPTCFRLAPSGGSGVTLLAADILHGLGLRLQCKLSYYKHIRKIVHSIIHYNFCYNFADNWLNLTQSITLIDEI